MNDDKPAIKPIMELTDEHLDGTIYVDGEGDLWQPCVLGGWWTSRWLPFGIAGQPGIPEAKYGPYVAITGPPEPPEPRP